MPGVEWCSGRPADGHINHNTSGRAGLLCVCRRPLSYVRRQQTRENSINFSSNCMMGSARQSADDRWHFQTTALRDVELADWRRA